MAWLLHHIAVIPTQTLHGQMTMAAEGRTIAGHRMNFRSAMGPKIGLKIRPYKSWRHHLIHLSCWTYAGTVWILSTGGSTVRHVNL